MPRTSNVNPRDLTGRQAELLKSRYAQELKSRQAEIGLITAPGDEDDGEVIELGSTGPTELSAEDGGVVEVEQPKIEIRVNSDLEDCTIGHGNHYSFYVGKRYKVPPAVAAHLEEKGYLYH